MIGNHLTTATRLICLVGMISLFSSCTNTDIGTATGGAAGAGLGYAVSGGNPVGTVVGAGAGALIGNSIGQAQDRPDFYGYN